MGQGGATLNVVQLVLVNRKPPYRLPSPPRASFNAPLRDCHIPVIRPLRHSVASKHSPGMTTYGYIRTSRQRPQSVPGRDRSSAYRVAPVTLAAPSWIGVDRPMFPLATMRFPPGVQGVVRVVPPKPIWD